MKKTVYFISVIGIVFLSLTSTAYASKLVSVSIVDKDHIMLFFKDGDVTFNESNITGGSPFPLYYSNPSTSNWPTNINAYVANGTALATNNVGTVNNWKVICADDPNFGTAGVSPSNVYRKSKLGCMAQMGWQNNDFNYSWGYDHTLFLKLPAGKSLTAGKTYTITIPNNIQSDVTTKTVTFDIFNNRSEAIKTNIVGYSTADAIKSADVYIWLGDGGARDYASFVGKKIYIYDINCGTSTQVGTLSLWAAAAGETRHNHQMIRSSVWKADFTGFNTAGKYRLAVEDIGCSEDFEIKPDIYYEPFKVSTQGFYYMRIGEDSRAAGVGNNPAVPVTRLPLFIPGTANCKVIISTLQPWHAQWGNVTPDQWDDPGSKIWTQAAYNTGRTNPNAWGGHSDALDWDRHLGHVSIIYDMLLPYFLTNGKLSDDNLRIGESGNNIPDILDEARYEVDFWLRLRDGKGYSHGLTCPVSIANPTFYQAGNTTVAAFANAANAAMLGDCFRILWENTGSQQHQKLMETYRDSAIVAYSYAKAQTDYTQTLTRGQNVGDAYMTGKDFMITAAAYLYNLTGNTTYENDLESNSRCRNSSTSISDEGTHNELYAAAGYLLSNRAKSKATLLSNMRTAVVNQAKSQEANYTLSTNNNRRPSRRSTDQSNGWFVSDIHNQRSIVAHAISAVGSADRKLFEDALILEADYSLGRNPMNIIHMTTATTALANKKSIPNAYTSGWNDGTPGVHPGHTPYMSPQDWGGTMIMGKPSWMVTKNYPAVTYNGSSPNANSPWPHAELYYNSRYVYAANEFTPQQSMRGKQALYGYLYAIRPESVMQQVATPTADPVTGSTVNKNSTVTLASATPCAKIYYTLDNTNPSAASLTTLPIVITKDVTIKAIAIKDGMTDSDVATFVYTVCKNPIPTTNVASGSTVSENSSVTLSTTVTGGTVHYTTDGTNPSTASLTTQPIVITKDVTIKAIVINANCLDSDVAEFVYAVEGTVVVTPTANPVAGPVDKNTTVTLSTTTVGATIYYTLDGSDPSVATGLTAPITITQDVTIKAIAVKAGMTNSNIATFTYTVCKNSVPATTVTSGSEVNKNSSVTLSTTETGGTVRYTLDGSDPSATSGLTAQPIIITAGVTIKAMVVSANCLDSNIATFVYTVCKNSVPITNVTSGSTVDKNSSVTLTTTETGATIRYTLDGSNPSATTGLTTQPIVITNNVTIKAIVISTNCLDSDVATFTYTICKNSVPGTTVTSGSEVDKNSSVTLSTTEAGGTVYYTTDGTNPSASTGFTAQPIVITAGVTIKAIVVSANCLDSDVATFIYTVCKNSKPGTTVASGSEVDTNSSVTLTTTETGATIRYTLDGSNPSATSGLTAQPIVITTGVTIKAMVVSAKCLDSDVAEFEYTIKIPGQVAKPIANEPSGTVYKNTPVMLTTTTDGATIYYTLDGSDPVSGLVYTQPIILTENLTILAIAVKAGMSNSQEAVYTYTICKNSIPGATVTSGSVVEKNSSVTLTTTETGGTIRYTLDGSNPSATSGLTAQPIVITSSVTIKAIVTGNCLDSDVANFNYTVINDVEQVAELIANEPSGTVNKNTPITLTTTTSDATIYYTLDGSDPISGLVYTQPIVFTGTGNVTLKAIAVKAGMSNSEIAIFEYTVIETNSIVEVNSELKDRMIISPNPARGGNCRILFTIPDDELKDCYIVIYSVLGEKVYENRRLTTVTEIQGLPQGYYVVQLLDMNNRYRQTRNVTVID